MSSQTWGRTAISLSRAGSLGRGGLRSESTVCIRHYLAKERFILSRCAPLSWVNASPSTGIFVSGYSDCRIAHNGVERLEYTPGGCDDVRCRQALQTYFVIRDSRCYSAFVGLLLCTSWRRRRAAAGPANARELSCIRLSKMAHPKEWVG